MPGEVLVRRTGPADEVGPVIGAAFGDDGATIARLWDEIENSESVRASIVAERDGELLGHVGLSHAWVDARRELVDVWLLSPLSVVPDWQGRGVGSLLLAAAIEEARASDAPALFLEGSPDYYGARGFGRASAHGFRPASARTPDAAFQVIVFDNHQDWMTGQLIYRDVWWRHDAAGLRDPLLATLEETLR